VCPWPDHLPKWQVRSKKPQPQPGLISEQFWVSCSPLALRLFLFSDELMATADSGSNLAICDLGLLLQCR